MGFLNKVLLIGRIGQDPELRTTPSGHRVVNISLATTEYFKDQAGQKQERTEWHRLQFWNRQAEVVAQYCRKGSQIYVEGALQTREWQDKDGNRRFSTDIVVRNLQLLDPKPQNGQQQHSQPQQAGNAPQYQQNQPYYGNHEVPPGVAQAFPDATVEDDIPY